MGLLDGESMSTQTYTLHPLRPHQAPALRLLHGEYPDTTLLTEGACS